MKHSYFDIIVIGGGAAGYFAAINAKTYHPEKSVAIIEKSNKVLSKVKISGGGRCNVTHACSSIPEMLKAYPRGKNFLRTAFQQFFVHDTIEWFDLRGVPLKVENDGRMFPKSNSSQTIIDCFLEECKRLNIQQILQEEILQIDKKEEKFFLQSRKGKNYQSKYLIIASGGYPNERQFEWIKDIPKEIDAPYPSLFTFNLPKHPICEYMGLSVQNASVSIPKYKIQQEGPILVTHWGLSGPAVLKLSAWGAKALADCQYQFDFTVNFLPEFHQDALGNYLMKYKESNGKKLLTQKPFQEIPQRLWQYFLQQVEITEEKWADVNKKKVFKLAQYLTQHPFHANGKTTFKEEFVTAGGVLTNQINAKTMQSKTIPNLYFAGECLNIDGVTGGFNFQAAWTTAFIAGQLKGE